VTERDETAAVLTESDFQLAFVLRALATRSGTEGFTFEELRALGEQRFEERLLPWDELFARLHVRGLLVAREHRYTLTESGKAYVTSAMSEGFGYELLGIAASRTYATFCERVYGRDLTQFSMMDEQQLETLLDSLDLCAQDQVLDVGCGVGRITEYLAHTSGATFIGLDFAPPVIEAAQRRTSGKADRLQYVVGNMDVLDLPRGSFTAIIAIDTLYFAQNLSHTIGRMVELLTQGGRLALFWSQSAAEGQENRLGPEETKLARVLQDANLTYTTTDFTLEEASMWRRALDTAEALRGEFEVEGRLELYQGTVAESRLWLSEADRRSRFLYLVRHPEERLS